MRPYAKYRDHRWAHVRQMVEDADLATLEALCGALLEATGSRWSWLDEGVWSWPSNGAENPAQRLCQEFAILLIIEIRARLDAVDSLVL